VICFQNIALLSIVTDFLIFVAKCFIAEIVRQKGLENITVDDLVAEITPKGRGMN